MSRSKTGKKKYNQKFDQGDKSKAHFKNELPSIHIAKSVF